MIYTVSPVDLMKYWNGRIRSKYGDCWESAKTAE